MAKKVNNRILVVEDEESIRTFLVLSLKREGYDVVEAESGEQAMEFFEQDPNFLIIISDVMMPGIDGFEVVKRVREADFRGGIIMLTAKSLENDRITGFMNGADDYVTKPYSVIELVMRVKSLERRLTVTKQSSGDLIVTGIFELNLARREVNKNGTRIDLTQVEFEILKQLMMQREKVLSRVELMNIVWGKEGNEVDTKIIDVNIRRLRIKIEDDPAEPRFISAVRGVGYRWEG